MQESQRWISGHHGELPAAVAGGGHFGATMRSFILYQYYHALVTEPLLLGAVEEPRSGLLVSRLRARTLPRILYATSAPSGSFGCSAS